MKRCSVCNNEKPLSEFKLRRGRGAGSNTLYPHSWCKPCLAAKLAVNSKAHRARNPAYSAEHQAKRRSNVLLRKAERERARELYALNRNRERARKKAWFAANPEKSAEYRKANPDVVRAIKARYRAALLNAMPWWVSQEEIKAIFKAARPEMEATGEKLHVDHIIPLQGHSVCGLHVPWNLQILPASVNQSKGNRMPDFN